MKITDIGIIGVPFDGGVTNRPGSRHGPREVRNQSTPVEVAPSFDPSGNIALAGAGILFKLLWVVAESYAAGTPGKLVTTPPESLQGNFNGESKVGH